METLDCVLLDQLIPFILTVALASSISLYPVVLIAPAILQFSTTVNVRFDPSRVIPS